MSRSKWAMVLAVVVVLAAYVWPTLWRYSGGDRGIGMVRVHRFNGRTEMLTLGGWRNLTARFPTEQDRMDAVLDQCRISP